MPRRGSRLRFRLRERCCWSELGSWLSGRKIYDPRHIGDIVYMTMMEAQCSAVDECVRRVEKVHALLGVRGAQCLCDLT